MQTKTLPIYLEPLLKYQEILKTFPDVTLIENTSESSRVEYIRGSLLRILDEQEKIKQTKNNNNGIFGIFYSFFKPNEAPSPLALDLIAVLQNLARDFPQDDVDPITREPIEDAPYFLSVNGRKYRLSTLAAWIRVCGEFILPDRMPIYIPEMIELKRLCEEFKFSLTKNFIFLTLPMDLTTEHIHPDERKQMHKSHITTIEMLEGQRLSLSEIVQEMRGLNFYQSEALFELFSKGLRGDHLRTLDLQEFGPHHISVLKMLINEWGYSIEKALHSILDCDFESIQDFYAMENPNDCKI